MIVCLDCKRELDHRSLQNAWQRVTGWEHRRKAGGTNAIALRETIDVFLCDTCMIGRKQGAKANQGSLL